MVDASYKGNTSQIDRLNRLTEKLNNSTLDSPKNSKFEFLTSRIGDLNNHLDEIVAQTAKKFGIIKENINLIAKQLDEENQKAENLLESKNHYIKLLEQKITERFNQESQIREEIGKKLFTSHRQSKKLLNLLTLGLILLQQMELKENALMERS